MHISKKRKKEKIENDSINHSYIYMLNLYIYIVTLEAASLINILALSPQIAGTVNTYSISSESTVPKSLVEISSNIWSFKNLMQCSNTLMASSSLPLISLHFTPRLSSCSTNQQTFKFVNYWAIIFKNVCTCTVTKLSLLKQVFL